MITRRSGQVKYWTDDKIEQAILEVVRSLKIDHMPSSTQVREVTKGEGLHQAICKYGTYRGWAERLNLKRNESDTNKGNDYEEIIAAELSRLGFDVVQTSSKHPYDLLVNGTTKIDVKVGASYLLRGQSRVVTFATNKKQPTCDFYICVRLDEQDEIEKIHVIPSHQAQVTTICMGETSKYDKFINRYDLIRRHHELINSMYFSFNIK